MFKVLKRLRSYDEHDWRHVRFLFKNMFKQLVVGEYGEAKDAFYFLKLHLTHDSERVRKGDRR